jgi:hypothetical protein
VPPIPLTPIPAPEMKITIFDSTSERTEHFLHQCEVYFLGTPSLTAQQCIMFMLLYMSKGHALSWAEQTLEIVVDPDYIADWGVFKNNVRGLFRDSDWVAMAWLRIKEVKQGHELVNDYVVWFEEFEGFMGLNDAALVEIFKEGLSSQILFHCYSLETVPMMLVAWKEKGHLFYHNYVELQHHHQGLQPQQQQQQACHQPQPGSSHQGTSNPPAPSSNPTAPVKLEPTDAKLGQTHCSKCYCWGGEGHLAQNCPQCNACSWCSGSPQQCCQIWVADTSELQFEERVNDDEKGKGKAKEEEKEALPDRVEQTGIDWWRDEDKKDLVDYLKWKSFWSVLVSHCLTPQTLCKILAMLIILKCQNVPSLFLKQNSESLAGLKRVSKQSYSI